MLPPSAVKRGRLVHQSQDRPSPRGQKTVFGLSAEPITGSHPIFHNAVASKYEERSREVDEDVRALHDQIMIDRTLEPLVKDGK